MSELPTRVALQHRLRRTLLPQDRSGAVAVIFATSIIPIMMLVGLVIDMGWTLQAKSDLDLAADAAALAGVRTAAAGYAAGQTKATYLAEGQLAASQWWTAQSGKVPEVTSSTDTPVVTQTGQTFSATVSYTAQVQEVLPNIFGWTNPNTGHSNANIANSSIASITVQAYGTLDFVLDNTSSMMLPATDADLTKLQLAEQAWLTGPNKAVNVGYVNNGGSSLVGWNANGNSSYGTGQLPLPNVTPAAGNYCAFACHWNATSTATNPTDYYGLARAAGETLRFDIVQSATITAIQTMESLEQVNGQLSLGIYTFGGPVDTAPNYLSTVFPEAPLDPIIGGVSLKNLGGTAAINAMKSITPPVTGDVADTDIGQALTQTLAITGNAGNGNTAATPLKSVILVTDGLEDSANPQQIPATEGPMNPAVCNAMKTAGYTIYILYTPYNPKPQYLPNNYALEPYLVSNTSPSVLASLQSCATSPNDVIQATSPDDIQAGMTTLIDEAVGSTTRFTN